MPEDNILSFPNPKKPLLLKEGTSRHKLTNFSDKKLKYKISFENQNSCFSVDQASGEVKENGDFALTITRKPGVGRDDKLVIEYSGELSGKTVMRLVPIE
ncbi:hypothetical protein OESDEN_17056 [Oesophagostomum dentatum]|uniref:MSP domain-containing protein n=1 Tax=Oesophagostomum dentatum TaxID=61180 RepID=A0A0B1SI99_OESDE|nr:hypothetical protein OESDEN_17056 [Oesophagostomum dentatum]